MEPRSTWKHFKSLLMHACVSVHTLSLKCMGVLTRIPCTRWMNCVCLRGIKEVCVSLPSSQVPRVSLFSSCLSEEQSFLSVSQSVFGEMIVGFREREALFGQEQARIALFPFIIILLLSPPNILLYNLLSLCPLLPYCSLTHSFLFIPVLPIPKPSTHFSSPRPFFPVSPSPDWGSVLLVRQPMCPSVCVRER